MATVLTSLSRLVAPGDRAVGRDIADAREALEYWTRREATLPWYRRAARRECRAMIAAWRASLVDAHLERLGMRRAREVVVPWLGRGDGRPARSALRWLRRTTAGRVVLALAVAWTTLSLAALALVVAVVVLLADG